MSLIELLNQPLKGEDLVELLELHDAEVIYHYDRCHENLDDSYSTQIADLGLEFRFDQNQKLETIFITVADVDVNEVFDGEIVLFASLQQAIGYAEQERLPFRQGRGEFFGAPRVWIRIQYSTHFAHYEFQPDELAMISLTTRDVFAERQ